MAVTFIAGLREWRRALENGNPRESQVAGASQNASRSP